MEGIHVALAEVARILTAYYGPRHVLFGSLRVKDANIHLHVFPVTKQQEDEWRRRKGDDYASGRFFEFLGDHERDASSAHRCEREWKTWTNEHQRPKHTDALTVDVASLSKLASER